MKKVAIVGVEGSGKTVMLAGLGDLYTNPDEEGYFLAPKNFGTSAYVADKIARMRQGEWPVATAGDEMLGLNWTLRQREPGSRKRPEDICEVSFLDFAGEVYRAAYGIPNSGDASLKKQVGELKQYVRGADDLIVLINLRDVITNGFCDKRVQEAMWITTAILDTALDTSLNKKVPRAAIVISQADSYAETIKACGGAAGVLQKYLPHVANNYGWLDIFCVQAVDKTAMDDDGNIVPACDFSTEGLKPIMDWVLENIVVDEEEEDEEEEEEGEEEVEEDEEDEEQSEEWHPGARHPRWPHVVAADKENNWRPEAGYTWVNPNDANDMSVKKKTATVHVRVSNSRNEEINDNFNLGTHVEISLPGGVRMEMIYCPPGYFRMGDNRNGGSPIVRLSHGFWLGRYPVTQLQWRSVMGDNPSRFKGDQLPIESVSWNDCQRFLQKVGDVAGFRLRLPTEAEWEYACRAGTTTDFNWGVNWSWDSKNSFSANLNCGGVAGSGKTTPVGKYRANAWGFYDMHGNVWEWCNDWYGKQLSRDAIDPLGPDEGTYRVRRGGGWHSDNYSCRSHARDNGNPSIRYDDGGFRLAGTLMKE